MKIEHIDMPGKLFFLKGTIQMAFALALFSITKVNGQTVESERSKRAFLGLRLGLDFVNYTGNPEGDSRLSDKLKSTTASTLGIFVEIPLSKEILLTPEASLLLPIDNSYVTVPVLVKYRPTSTRGINVFAGPSLGFFVTSNQKKYITSPGFAYKSYTKESVNYGFDLGVGYDFIRNLGVDVRYRFGLPNVIQNASSSHRTNNFQAAVRINFR